MEAKPLSLCGGARKLLVISDDPAVLYKGTVYASGTVARFWVELAKLFEDARISMPLKTVEELEKIYPAALEPGPNTAISGRRFHHSKWDALGNPATMLAGATSLYRDVLWADTILYRLPSALLPLVLPVLFLARGRKKTVLYIVGDLFGRNAEPGGGFCVRRAMRNGVAASYDFIERLAARCFVTLATGERLCAKYSARPFDVSLIAGEKVLSRPKGFDPGRIRLLFVGKLDPPKGADVLLSALGMLDEGMKKILWLTVVGSGPEEASLREQARSLGVDEMVEFSGAVPFERVAQYYREADIFVLPSHSEGVPKVLYEAMAAGLAIVATDVGGVPTVTDGGRCALLVPPSSPQGIKDALSRLVSDEALRKGLVENGLRKVSENTMEKKLARLERLLKG